MSAIIEYETDTAAPDAIGAFGTGLSLSTGTAALQMSTSGTPGSAAQGFGNGSSGTNLIGLMFETPADEPRNTAGLGLAGQIWSVYFDVTGITGMGVVTLNSCYVLRVNQAGVAQQTLASATGIGKTVGAGLNSPPGMLQSAPAVYALNDKVVVLLSFDYTAIATVNFKSDSQVTCAASILDDGSESFITYGIRTEW